MQSQIFPYATHAVTYSPFAIRWIPCTSRVVSVGETARGTGIIEVYELKEACLSRTLQFEHEKGIKCLTFDASDHADSCPAIGGFRGSVSIYDMNQGTLRWNAKTAHSGIVNSIDGCIVGSPEVVSGSRDGKVKVWDPRLSDAVLTIEPSSGNADCWTVCFGNCANHADKVVVAGYDNGDVKMVDLRKNDIRWETNVKNGVCHVSFDRKDISMNKLSVGCLQGDLVVYDMRTKNEKSGYAGLESKIGKCTIWGCQSMPQNREIMAVTTGSGEMRLYKYSYPMKRSIKDTEGELVGVPGSLECIGNSDFLSTQPLVSFDWHPSKKGLFATSAFDQVITVGICSNLE